MGLSLIIKGSLCAQEGLGHTHTHTREASWAGTTMPLTLYRNILRLHRQLPPMMRQLGDTYVREEFKQHKTANAQQTQVFMEQWRDYARQIEAGVAVGMENDVGSDLDESELHAFNDEQKAQLDKLREQAQGTDMK